MISSKRKTTIQVELSIWAEVRYFATLNNVSTNAGLETLLVKALKKSNQEHGMLAGEIDFGIHSPAASSDVT